MAVELCKRIVLDLHRRKLAGIQNLTSRCRHAKCAQEEERGETVEEESGNQHSALPYDAIPGPKPVPIFGNFWRFLPIIGEYPRDNQVLLITKLKNKYGNLFKLTALPGRRDIVVTCNAKDFEKIYRTEGQWPKRNAMPSYKHYRNHIRKDFFNGVGSMVTEQGKEWYDIRNLANQPMLHPRLTQKYIQPIGDVASDFVKRMEKIRDSSGTLPETFGNELNKWALESIALIAMDTRMGCLEDNLPRNSDAQRLVDAVLTMMKLTYELDFSPSLTSAIRRKRFYRALDVQFELSMKYINKCLERLKQRGEEDTSSASVLEHVLATGNTTAACVIVMDMLHAGIDTTAKSVENLIFHLSKNSVAQERLRDELMQAIPEVDSPITQDIIARLPYLRACVKESMRITPTAIGSLREVGKDIVLSGYQIPKDTIVAMYNIETSNNPEEYPQPESYRPERWLREEDCKKFNMTPAKSANAFSFLPFGFGPRACIGQRFAYLEMEILIAKIFRKWSVTYERDHKFQSKLFYSLATPPTFRLTEI